MTHTPGPWHRNIKPASKYVTVWSGRNKHVAYVANKGLTEDEIEDNINLIAAAPEMLEALRGLLKWCAGDVLDLPEVNAARAAIAKAEGREG